MQLTDTDMNERMLEINEELAQLKGIDKFDIVLDADAKGNVKVNLITRNPTAYPSLLWTQGYSDSLEHISHLFNDSDVMTIRTTHISKKGLKNVHFNDRGKLIISYEDGDMLEYKVKKEDREKVSLILKERLGNKFNELTLK